MRSCKLFSLQLPRALVFLTVTFVSLFVQGIASAAEKEEVKALLPPEIKIIVPFGILVGETNQIKIRGLNFTNISDIKVSGASNVIASFMQPVKSDPPKGTEKDDSGDMQIEGNLFIAQQTVTNDLQIIVYSNAGNSKPALATVLSKETFISEKEPNGSFTKAKSVKIGQTMHGSIENPNDVDVFSFEAAKGDKFTIRILGRYYGSRLDSLVSVFDSKQHLIASSDDSAKGRDSNLLFEAKSNGKHFVTVVDANDTGSSLHLYYLQISHQIK